RRSPWFRVACVGWRCARGRWWSTVARVAAPRTPGCSKNKPGPVRHPLPFAGITSGPCTMLSRTADSLCEMSRYIERAESTARMLEVNLQVMLMPQSRRARHRDWRSVLDMSGLNEAFDARYDTLDARNVIECTVRDGDNPSCSYSCVRAA